MEKCSLLPLILIGFRSCTGTGLARLLLLSHRATAHVAANGLTSKKKSVTTRVAEEYVKAGRQEGKGAVGAATLRRQSAAALRLCAPARCRGPARRREQAFHGDGVEDRV